MFEKNPKFIEDLTSKLFIHVINIYESNNQALFRYLNLICVEKMLSFADEKTIKKVVDVRKLSFFVQKTIKSRDMLIVSISIQIIEQLVLKVPSIINCFYREGVINQLDQLRTSKSLQSLKIFRLSTTTNTLDFFQDNDLEQLKKLEHIESFMTEMMQKGINIKEAKNFLMNYDNFIFHKKKMMIDKK